MMVPDGIREEVPGVLRRELHHHLRAAEMVLILVVQELPFRGEPAVQLAGDLEHRHGAFRQFAVDAHADPGLEMRVVLPAFHHVEGHGAMGEEDAAGFRVDLRRIGLEARFSAQRLRNHHGQERGDIALTGGREAVGVEGGQRQAARVVDGGEQVEAAERERA